jgi:hypothetical protein
MSRKRTKVRVSSSSEEDEEQTKVIAKKRVKKESGAKNKVKL